MLTHNNDSKTVKSKESSSRNRSVFRKHNNEDLSDGKSISVCSFSKLQDQSSDLRSEISYSNIDLANDFEVSDPAE